MNQEEDESSKLSDSDGQLLGNMADASGSKVGRYTGESSANEDEDDDEERSSKPAAKQSPHSSQHAMMPKRHPQHERTASLSSSMDGDDVAATVCSSSNSTIAASGKRTRRQLSEVELEVKRLSNRLSSRRSQERKRQQITYLQEKQGNLKLQNGRLKDENKHLLETINRHKLLRETVRNRNVNNNNNNPLSASIMSEEAVARGSNILSLQQRLFPGTHPTTIAPPVLNLGLASMGTTSASSTICSSSGIQIPPTTPSGFTGINAFDNTRASLPPSVDNRALLEQVSALVAHQSQSTQVLRQQTQLLQTLFAKNIGTGGGGGGESAISPSGVLSSNDQQTAAAQSSRSLSGAMAQISSPLSASLFGPSTNNTPELPGGATQLLNLLAMRTAHQQQQQQQRELQEQQQHALQQQIRQLSQDRQLQQQLSMLSPTIFQQQQQLLPPQQLQQQQLFDPGLLTTLAAQLRDNATLQAQYLSPPQNVPSLPSRSMRSPSPDNDNKHNS